MVEEFPVSELDRWAVRFAMQNELASGGKKTPSKQSSVTPDTISVENSQALLMELFRGNKG
jgi:hypothetical protein